MLGSIVRGFVGLVRSILTGLTDPPLSVSSSHAILRHSPPLVFYQGADTTVVFSTFGTATPPSKRTVFLQRRGWIAGLLGWGIGGYAGGAWSKGFEVTPEKTIGWFQESGEDITASGDVDADTYRADDALPPVPEVRKRKLRAEVEKFAPPDGMSYLETLILHVPAAAPDGYYRILLCASPTHRPSATSTTFRLYSSSFSTPSPRGANLYQLLPELLFSTLAASFYAILLALFTALFPFAKLASLLPGGWGKKALRWVWSLIGGEEVERKVKGHETVKNVTDRVDKVDRSLPWSKAGVRRKRDARDDGSRGGVAIRP